MDCDRSFRIDAQQLQRRFRSLQRAVHPDRFGQRPPVSAGPGGSPGRGSRAGRAPRGSVTAGGTRLWLRGGVTASQVHGAFPVSHTDWCGDAVYPRVEKCILPLVRFQLFAIRLQKEQYYSEQHSSLINKAYQTLLNPLSRGLYLLELSGVEPAQETDCDADSAFLMEIMEINEKLADPKNEGILEEIETLIKVKQEELTREVTAAFERDDLQEAKKLLAKMKYFANLEDKLKAKKIPS
ncbi:iron-sulfur cluster co-chaperone protein HscB [Aphelocoma coerulescens]|uniref:iron-sulfur cluster co-chaperone protein HscB n=1 Tax=Aphelocoma coerulescens TaxID=39617 RepID=UPI00360520DC